MTGMIFTLGKPKVLLRQSTLTFTFVVESVAYWHKKGRIIGLNIFCSKMFYLKN